MLHGTSKLMRNRHTCTHVLTWPTTARVLEYLNGFTELIPPKWFSNFAIHDFCSLRLQMSVITVDCFHFESIDCIPGIQASSFHRVGVPFNAWSKLRFRTGTLKSVLRVATNCLDWPSNMLLNADWLMKRGCHKLPKYS